MYKELKEVWRQLTATGGAFEVIEVEVRGSVIKAYAAAPPSLREVWLASSAFADRDYLVYEEERWTYAQAHRDVAAFVCWLGKQGVGPGDRVGIAMRNYPEWLLCYWAIVSMGATVVGFNAWWTETEMTYGLEDSAPMVLICDQERLERVLPRIGQFKGMKLVGVRLTNPVEGVVPFDNAIEEEGTLPEVTIDPDSDACIFYTSGTTGKPKGAQLTHRGCVNNVMNLAFWGTASAMALAKKNHTELPNPEDAPAMAGLINTPLFHVTANNCIAQGATLGGGKLVHMYKWDAGEALRLIEKEKITNTSGVPTMSREIISHPDFDKYDTSSLIAVAGGGAQLQPDLVRKIDETVKTARPGTGYGMTETCGIITSISGDFFIDKPDSAGPAMPVFDAKCVDDNGNQVPLGQVGELWVKGAPVIAGYLNRPEDTAESITDGWLHTGDVARIDEDGFIFIVDRKKDMVLRGGENVYCAEVESAIFNHDAVVECAVFGVEDERLGEEVGAAIFLKAANVTKKDASALADEIREQIGKDMAKHKVPRYIWFTQDALPRNATGKFLKRELREMLDIADAV